MFSLTSQRVLIEFLVRSPQSPRIRAPESCALPGQGRAGVLGTPERKALGPRLTGRPGGKRTSPTGAVGRGLLL